MIVMREILNVKKRRPIPETLRVESHWGSPEACLLTKTTSKLPQIHFQRSLTFLFVRVVPLTPSF